MKSSEINKKSKKNNKKLLTPKVKLAIITHDEEIHQRGGQRWLNLKNDVKKSLNPINQKRDIPAFLLKTGLNIAI